MPDNFKDIILYYDGIIGKYTINDLINDIKGIKKDYQEIENIVLNILEHTEMTDKDIASIFRADISSSLDLVVDLLEQNI